MRRLVFLLPAFLITFFPRAVFADDVLIEICDWQGCAAGAASISIDDSFTSCRDILNQYGFKGTYYLTHTDKFSQEDWNIWRSIYAEGHEIGGHTTDHNCVPDLATLRWELSSNKNDIVTNLKVPEEELSSFAWPCGITNAESSAIASEYYVSARGYHINELEDKNPADFMNLKSLNTPHYHDPSLDIPYYYFQKADEAEALGKWVNFVFHNHCLDDGAIGYLATKDLWVAPVGKVVKYIKERQNSDIINIVQTDSEISFVLTNTLDPYLFDEKLTIKISVSPADVQTVLINSNPTTFISGIDYIMFNVQPSQSSDIRIVRENMPRENGNDILEPKEEHNEAMLRPLKELKRGDGAVVNIWISGQAKLDNLREHKIKYLFVDIGNTNQNGTMETPKKQITEFLELIESYEKQHNYDFVILPYSEVNTYHYNIDAEFKGNFIAVYSHLISLGFDGVYVDIEPIRKGQEEDYLELLKDLSGICPQDKILGIYAGVVDSESDNERNNEWQWSLDLYRKVSNRVDLICVPGYDTNLRNREDYKSFIRKQIKLLASRQSNARLMLAIPTHKREPETIENALESYDLVIKKYPQNHFIGVYIFAEWTTDIHEWDVFKSRK